MNDKDRIDEPMNATERYMHGINVRLNILIDMFSSFLEAYGSVNQITSTNNTHNEIEVATEATVALDEMLEDEVDYDAMTKAQIQEILTKKGIEYTSSMTKTKLIELLQ